MPKKKRLVSISLSLPAFASHSVPTQVSEPELARKAADIHERRITLELERRGYSETDIARHGGKTSSA